MVSLRDWLPLAVTAVVVTAAGVAGIGAPGELIGPREFERPPVPPIEPPSDRADLQRYAEVAARTLDAAWEHVRSFSGPWFR